MAIVDVIEYQGSNDVLVYRYPTSDFNTLSQLVVRETQVAVLYKDGKKADEFGPGRYTMHTGNIPLLSSLVNLPFGGVSPFQCEVYYINKALSLHHSWGTKEPARTFDKTYNIPLEIGVNGAIGLQVIDPYKLMTTIVGTEEELTTEACLGYFKSNISMKAKEYIAQVMQRDNVNYRLLDSQLSAFSKELKSELDETFEEVGVSIYNFIIRGFQIPREQYEIIEEKDYQMHLNDLNKRKAEGCQEVEMIGAKGEAERMGVLSQAEAQKALLEAQTTAQAMVMEAQAKAQEIVLQGKAEAEVQQIQGFNRTDLAKEKIALAYAQSGQPQSNPASMLAQAPAAMLFGSMLANTMEPVMNPEFSTPGVGFEGSKTTSTAAKPAEDVFGLAEDDLAPEPAGEETAPATASNDERTKQFLLKCDICGGELVMLPNRTAKCRICGMTYALETLQEKMRELRGTAQV